MATRDAVKAYLDSHRARGSSERTIGMYRSVLQRFEKMFELLPTEPEKIEAFLARFPGSRTKNNYYRVLRWFYKFASNRYGVLNPTDEIKSPKVRRKLPPSLSQAQTRQLLSQPFGSKRDKRNRALLLVLAGCGLRVGEARNLRFVDISEHSLNVRGKTGERQVPLFSEVEEALLALRDGHKDTDPIFWGEHPCQPLGISGMQSIVRQVFQKVGIKGVRPSPHTLRHTFGRNWVAGGGDLVSLQRIMGHTSIEQTQLYVQLSQEDIQGKNAKFNPLLPFFEHNIPPADGHILSLDKPLSQW
jgi:integrase/recombinase XerD